MRNEYNILSKKHEENITRRRLIHTWEDNIRMDLRVTVWEGVDCMSLAQDRDKWRVLEKTVMNLRVP